MFYRLASKVIGSYTGTLAGGRGSLAFMRSAILSAIMIVGALRLPLATWGITDASTTLKPSIPEK